jgi:cytochrome c-type biogenesis protein
MKEIGLAAALLAGLLSFLSPCVLPLIPAYLSMVSGYAVEDIRSGSGRWRTLGRSLAFSAGFTLLFCALGLAFSGAALLLGGLSRAITIASGCLIALLGLNMIFDFIKLLDRELKPQLGKARGRSGKRGYAPRGYAGAFFLGLAFGAGWTPCVGPILASILLLASQEGNAARAGGLLAAYSAGLALPFLAAGLFLDRLTPIMTWLKRHGELVRITSGIILVALGAAMALGKLAVLSSIAAPGS